jgi:peroxin-1
VLFFKFAFKCLQGVTVIGATSRPELLDPALLRSGRMDRLVECPLPNAFDRQQIFMTLSKSLAIEQTVDWKKYAGKTQNFTGADIKSILTTANMTAVQRCFDQTEGVSVNKQ